eukprot:TRINITY_DN6816_c0_g1_i1.p1 TRINITY_DN6816_c0_g1~~TRINITY_DN6816_c0_g1_i1.p1  ORF type:complete len:297 (-),score=39.66 TRINITY_DN6816_c0_g1_i1:30-920(-)
MTFEARTSVDLSDEEFARRLQAEEEAYFMSNRGQDFECLLCLEDKTADEGKRLHCGHMICLQCFKNFAQTIVEKTDLLHCPSCNEIVTSGEIRSVLGPDFANRYETIETIKLRQEIGLFHCMTADCPNSVFVEDGITKFYCSVCQHTYCTQCKTPYHMDLSCEEFQEDLIRRKNAEKNSSPNPDSSSTISNEEYLEKLLKDGMMKQCKCGNYIEKNGGCWYILCPMCHLGFCWKCNKILGNGNPNCEHTFGHIANPSQWVRSDPIRRLQEVIRDSEHVAANDNDQGRARKKRCNIM